MIKKSFVLICLSFFSCSTGVLKESQVVTFNREFIQLLTNQITNLTLLNQSEPLVIDYKDQNSIEKKIYLYYAYEDYQIAGINKAEVITQWVAVEKSVYYKERVISSDIFPILKDFDSIEDLLISAENERNRLKKLFWTKLGDDIFCILGQDTGKALEYLSKIDVATVSSNQNEVLEISLKNLRKRFPNIIFSGSNGFYELSGADIHAASFVIDKSTILKKLTNCKLNGEPIFGVPDRESLFVTGSKDPENIEKLYKVIQEKYLNQKYRISVSVYQFSDNGLKRFASK